MAKEEAGNEQEGQEGDGGDTSSGAATGVPSSGVDGAVWAAPPGAMAVAAPPVQPLAQVVSTSGSSGAHTGKQNSSKHTGATTDAMLRRKHSNRESARRSRERKQAEREQLECEVRRLKAENASLREHARAVDAEADRLRALLLEYNASPPSRAHPLVDEAVPPPQDSYTTATAATAPPSAQAGAHTCSQPSTYKRHVPLSTVAPVVGVDTQGLPSSHPSDGGGRVSAGRGMNACIADGIASMPTQYTASATHATPPDETGEGVSDSGKSGKRKCPEQHSEGNQNYGMKCRSAGSSHARNCTNPATSVGRTESMQPHKQQEEQARYQGSSVDATLATALPTTPPIAPAVSGAYAEGPEVASLHANGQPRTEPINDELACSLESSSEQAKASKVDAIANAMGNTIFGSQPAYQANGFQLDVPNPEDGSANA